MSETAPQGEIILYQTEDGRTRLECRFEDESIWLTQRLIGELFQVSVPTVNEHLANVFAEGELKPEATIRKFRIVQREGAREVARLVGHYNLDVILAVGYRQRRLAETDAQAEQDTMKRLEEMARALPKKRRRMKRGDA